MNSLQIRGQETSLAEQFTPKELELITNTIARGATPQELELFLYRCKIMGFNPLKPGQIHFVKYGQGPGTIVIGIEGFRSTGARTGMHVSTNRGVTRNEKGEIVCGWCKILKRDKSGAIQEYYEETPFQEYFNPKNPSWNKMPETMIKKCAEAACHRMAYPDDLGGVYIQEEEHLIAKGEDGFDQSSGPIKSDQPNADEGDPAAFHEYTPGFGQWSKYKLSEICKMKSAYEIEGYITKLEGYMRDGKYPENHSKMKEFIERMSAYLSDLEKDSVQRDVPY